MGKFVMERLPITGVIQKAGAKRSRTELAQDAK